MVEVTDAVARLCDTIADFTGSPLNADAARAILARANDDFEAAVNLALDAHLLPRASSSVLPTSTPPSPPRQPPTSLSVFFGGAQKRSAETAAVDDGDDATGPIDQAPNDEPAVFLGEITTSAFAVTSRRAPVPLNTLLPVTYTAPAPTVAAARKRARGAADSAAVPTAALSSWHARTATQQRHGSVRILDPATGSAMARFDHRGATPTAAVGWWLGALLDLGLVQASASVILAPDGPQGVRISDEFVVSLSLSLSTARVRELTASSQSGGTPEHDDNAVWSCAREPMCALLAAVDAGVHRAGLPQFAPAAAAAAMWTGFLDCGSSTSNSNVEDEEVVADSPAFVDGEDNVVVDTALVATVFGDSTSAAAALPEATDLPPGLAVTLRPYQRQALHWMLDRETLRLGDEADGLEPMHPLFFQAGTGDGRSDFWFSPFSGQVRCDFPTVESHARGGILADEMGLGKTIEMLALLHANPAPVSSPDGIYPATLIVVPLTLLAQWASEIRTASSPNSTIVLEFHGPGRSLPSAAELTKQLAALSTEERPAIAVVMTTFGTLQSEHSPSTTATISPLMNRTFHRIVLDEAHAIKSPNTLTTRACWAVSAPLRWALTGTPMQNSADDVYSLVRFLQYDPWAQPGFWRKYVSGPMAAEKARSASAARAHSAAAIAAAEEAARDAVRAVKEVMAQVVLRRTKATLINGKPIVDLPEKVIDIVRIKQNTGERDFYNALENHTKVAFSDYVRAGTVLSNYTNILALISRLRQCCDHPALVVHAVSQRKSGAGGSLQLEHTTPAVASLDSFIRKYAQEHAGDPSEFASTLFAQLTETQQPTSNSIAAAPSSPVSDECPLCFDPIDTLALLPCLHRFCAPCITTVLEALTARGDPLECPVCRRGVTEDQVYLVERNGGGSGIATPDTASRSAATDVVLVSASASSSARMGYGSSESTKVAATANLVHSFANPPPPPPVASAAAGGSGEASAAAVPEKTVVFTQFRGMLSLLETALTRRDVSSARLDGTMTRTQRDNAIARFRDDPECMCLVASLRAGNVGLNLTTASRVILVDPWWTHAVEQQAIDRVHRIGQTRAVHVTRLIVEGSVEERMLAVQDAKLALVARVTPSAATAASSSTGPPTESAAKNARVEELRMLFGF
ncbi:SNF2 family N-terminal domain-containing protein [Blastocladiella britannica]|nr:SNF2 family N-terminal domain-containing protein [Blastocladiella britannica]